MISDYGIYIIIAVVVVIYFLIKRKSPSTKPKVLEIPFNYCILDKNQEIPVNKWYQSAYEKYKQSISYKGDWGPDWEYVSKIPGKRNIMVVGISREKGSAAFLKLAQLDDFKMFLEDEPTNPVNKNARKVMISATVDGEFIKEQIGYLPDEIAKQYAGVELDISPNSAFLPIDENLNFNKNLNLMISVTLLQRSAPKVDPRSLEGLIVALRDGNEEERRMARTRLVKIGGPALESLIPYLKHGNRKVRKDVEITLGIINQNWWKTEAAKKLIPDFISSFQNTEPEIYLSAKTTLVKIGEPAVEYLVRALKHPTDWGIRRLAAIALIDIGAPQALKPLIDALKDSNETNRSIVIKGLNKIGDPSDLVEVLINTLKSDHSKIVRFEAVRLLGGIKDTRAVDGLIIALKDSHVSVRVEAATALGKAKDPRAIEPLYGALKDSSSIVRDCANNALAQLKK